MLCRAQGALEFVVTVAFAVRRRPPGPAVGCCRRAAIHDPGRRNDAHGLSGLRQHSIGNSKQFVESSGCHT